MSGDAKEILRSWDACAEHPSTRAFRLIEELTGLTQGRSQLRTTAYSSTPALWCIYDEHVDFVRWLNEELRPIEPRFTHDLVMDRWYLLNALLLSSRSGLIPQTVRFWDDPQWFVAHKGSFLASLVGFGLVEQLAALKSGVWNLDGEVNTPIRNPRLVGKNGTMREYREGEILADLRHKLILLEESLSSTAGNQLNQLNTRLLDWTAMIRNTSHLDLYERLFDARNRMTHGVKTDGWEGWLLTLLAFLIYADEVATA